jgi:DNA mismatch repair protein MutS2
MIEPTAPPPSCSPDLLNPVPTVRVDRAALRQALTFAFASGVSGGAFTEALDGARVEPTWDPALFAKDVFLRELVSRSFKVIVDGHDYVVSERYLTRLLAAPPTEAPVVHFRQAILRELSESAELRTQFERLYALLCRFRGALEGAAGSKWDASRRQLDILALAKAIFDHLASSFEVASSGLARLRELGLAVGASEPYRALRDLLDYDEHLATLTVKIRVGADGRVRGFDILSLQENSDNPFVSSPARRVLAKVELFARGYRFGEDEVMGRLLDAVFEGIEDEIAKLPQLVGDMELYLGALGFRDRALAAGLEASLPELVDADDGERELIGLFNPLLLAHGIAAVPCDLSSDRYDTTTIITGPNSGGKTRLLQSLGMAQLLAQAGLFVPARRARLALVPALVMSLNEEARADQSEGRLGMELLRIRALFERLPPRAMVVLDELCSGTNPSEGEEIFELVVTLLAELRPQAWITTHFLTFAARLEREGHIRALRFLQVELDPSQRPTYQFTSGVATTSLAEHAARRLGVTREQLLDLVQDSARREAPPVED